MNTPQNCPHPQFAVVDGRCTHCGKATPELKAELNKRYGRIAPAPLPNYAAAALGEQPTKQDFVDLYNSRSAA